MTDLGSNMSKWFHDCWSSLLLQRAKPIEIHNTYFVYHTCIFIVYTWSLCKSWACIDLGGNQRLLWVICFIHIYVIAYPVFGRSKRVADSFWIQSKFIACSLSIIAISNLQRRIGQPWPFDKVKPLQTDKWVQFPFHVLANINLKFW